MLYILKNIPFVLNGAQYKEFMIANLFFIRNQEKTCK